MNPLVGFLATWIPVGFLLYNFYHTAVHIYSLWYPSECDSSAPGARCLCPAYDSSTLIEFDIFVSSKQQLPLNYERSKRLLYSTSNHAIQLSWDAPVFSEPDETALHPIVNGTKYGLNKNRTLYAHVVGYYSDPSESYDKYNNIFSHQAVPVIYYDRPPAATFNLFDANSTDNQRHFDRSDASASDASSGAGAGTGAVQMKEEIAGLVVPYFVPNITIYYLVDQTCYNLSSIPNEIYSYLAQRNRKLSFSEPKGSKIKKDDKRDKKRRRSIGQLEYYPILYNSDLTRLHKYAIPLMNSYGEWWLEDESESVTSRLADERQLRFEIKIEPISLGFMRLYQTMGASCNQMEREWEFGKSDLDQIKGLFVDTNPWLTLATFVAAALHTIFSFLAMKSDISFWNASDRSLEGLSTNSVVFESVSSFVILAYLVDSEQANKIIIVLMLGECFLGLWKLKRIYSLKQQLGRIKEAKEKRKRKQEMEEMKQNKNKEKTAQKCKDDDSKKADMANKTESLDQKATRYMVYVLIPCVLGYSGYSFVYHTHKSMLSYVINSLASCVYGLGFIHLTPQLFINYELKSVEALPWKVLIYKFFNTFVDDLFSLIIDMPTLHRLACFRDDVVFIIFCIQWWIYGAKTRKKDDKQEQEKKKKQ